MIQQQQQQQQQQQAISSNTMIIDDNQQIIESSPTTPLSSSTPNNLVQYDDQQYDQLKFIDDSSAETLILSNMKEANDHLDNNQNDFTIDNDQISIVKSTSSLSLLLSSLKHRKHQQHHQHQQQHHQQQQQSNHLLNKSSKLSIIDNDSGNASIQSDEQSDDFNNCCCNLSHDQCTNGDDDDHRRQNCDIKLPCSNNNDSNNRMQQVKAQSIQHRRHSSYVNYSCVNNNSFDTKYNHHPIDMIMMNESLRIRFDYDKNFMKLLSLSTSNTATSKSFKDNQVKLNNGDLIEIHCICNCNFNQFTANSFDQSNNKCKNSFLNRNFLRSSSSSLLFFQSKSQPPPQQQRQRFRRSLHNRHSFIWKQQPQQLQPHSTQQSNQTNKSNRLSLTNLSRLLKRSSCIQSKIDDDDDHDDHSMSKFDSLSSSSSHSNRRQSNNNCCNEQYHYVYVDRIELDCDRNNNDDHSSAESTKNHLPKIWCFHVKPIYRLILLDDIDNNQNVGIVRYETLDMIISQLIIESEEKHWQKCNIHNVDSNQLKASVSINYYARNQMKFSQKLLRQTLNAQPDHDKIVSLLMNLKDSYVRYNKTALNSEHYCTMWKYGIGWSTWSNPHCDIQQTIRLFIERFATLVIPRNDFNSNSTNDHSIINHNSPLSSLLNQIFIKNGECLAISNYNIDSNSVNLIIHCFGLQSSKIDTSIAEWMKWQIVIDNKRH